MVRGMVSAWVSHLLVDVLLIRHDLTANNLELAGPDEDIVDHTLLQT